MSNTITNFLVGIGLDTTEFDRGSRNVAGGLNNIKSGALQLAAVAAGAFGAQQLTFGFAEATDRLGKFSEVFSVLPNDVAALGRALEHEGGSLDSFMGQLAGLEQLRSSNPQELGGLFQTAGINGVDPSVILSAKSATEAYIALSDVFDDLSGKQRIRAAKVFGLDEASIRLLSHGREELENMVQVEKDMRPVTGKMTEEAARFNDVNQNLMTSIGGVADEISMKLLPEISNTVEGMTKWIGANREFISSGINDVLDPMAEHITSIAVAGGLLASGGLLSGLAGMAKFVPLIGGGLSMAAIAAAKLTAVGAAGAAAYSISGIIDDQLAETIPGYREFDAKLTQGFFNIFNGESNGSDGKGVVDNPYYGLGRDTTDYSNYVPYSTPSQQVNSQNAPQAQQQKLPNINLTVQMDRDVIVNTIIDVNEKMNNTAVNDLTSTTKD